VDRMIDGQNGDTFVAHLASRDSPDFIKPYVSLVKSGLSAGRCNIYEIRQARARATIRVIRTFFVISARDVPLSARACVFTDGRVLLEGFIE